MERAVFSPPDMRAVASQMESAHAPQGEVVGGEDGRGDGEAGRVARFRSAVPWRRFGW